MEEYVYIDGKKYRLSLIHISIRIVEIDNGFAVINKLNETSFLK